MSKRTALNVAEVPPPAVKKQVESIPLEAVVRAYLESQLGKLQHDLLHKEEDLKKAEVSMVAQMQRFMGQREGEIEALKQQIAAIQEQLNPTEDTPPKGDTPVMA